MPESQKRFFYAVENLATGEVVRRGKVGPNGMAPNQLILAPETAYRHWLFHADSEKIGFVDFRTPAAGRGFSIPPVPMSLPMTIDSDQDGLTDDAEFILGTSPTNPDTDGDGIRDGAEVANGTNPADGLVLATGVVGTANTPGTALDVCAINDLAVLADGAAGVAVFNVFNRMQPLIIAQVDTPGTAERVTCTGNYVVVADGPAGLAIIDVTDPPAARVLWQMALGIPVTAVAASAGLGYAGTADGRVVVVELANGIVLDEARLDSGVQDLGIEGDHLIALTGSRLQVIGINEPTLRVVGSTAAGGLRLFVGGGFVQVTYSGGVNTFSIANPASPVLVASRSPGQTDWRHFVSNGSGLGLGIVGDQFSGTPVDLAVYNLPAPAAPLQYVTTLSTPGTANAVSLFNGFAYVADGEAGLQVANYRAADTFGKPPTIALSASFGLSTPTNGVAEEGKLARVSAAVADDVQVRNVEFYLDGTRVATDGNFPFEHRFFTPRIAPGRTSFRVRARASDTGGNFAWSEEIVVALTPDATVPVLRRTTPSLGGVAGTNVNGVVAIFNEPIDSESVTPERFQVFEPGPDHRLGTADDRLVPGTISSPAGLDGAVLSFSAPLPTGVYRMVISAGITDRVGNRITTVQSGNFGIVSGGASGDDDGDLLSNADEVRYGLNPEDPDTDGDRWSDRDEVDNGTKGDDPLSIPPMVFVAGPPVDVDLPVSEDQGIAGSPVVVAQPPVSVALPLPEDFGITGVGVAVAQPPIVVDLPLPEDFGISGVGVFVARPPVSAEIPLPEDFGIVGAGVVAAQPPVLIELPVPEDLGITGTPVVVAQPPVWIDLPVPEDLGITGTPGFLAQPPLRVEWAAPSPASRALRALERSLQRP